MSTPSGRPDPAVGAGSQALSPSTPKAPARRAASTTANRSDPRTRGRLVLAERVIEKIAGQAAAEIGSAHGRSGGFLGIGAEADQDAPPKVDVDLSENSADLAIKIGIAYPGSIRRATQQVRDHVTSRVFELAGVQVHRIDIDVTFLTPSADAITPNGARQVTPGSEPGSNRRRKELR